MSNTINSNLPFLSSQNALIKNDIYYNTSVINNNNSFNA